MQRIKSDSIPPITRAVYWNKSKTFACVKALASKVNARFVARSFALVLVIVSLLPAAYSASFDCDKANTDIEKTICEEEELSKLDDQMGATYKKMIRRSADKKRLVVAQKKWLVERNACLTVAKCLKTMYELRIAELLHNSGVTRDCRGCKGEFLLTRIMEPVCVPFRRNLNEFRHMEVDQCHPRLSDKFPQFTRPKWREVPLDLLIAENAYKGVTPLAYSDRADAMADVERRWQDWLKATEELRSNGEIKMWIADVDADNDGVNDVIARVQYAIPASDYPVIQRGCLYTHSGLWLVSAADEKKRKQFNSELGNVSDIILSSDTGTTYLLSWYDGDAGPEYMGRSIGATRGVRINLAGNWNLVPRCYINWVPEGEFRFPSD